VAAFRATSRRRSRSFAQFSLMAARSASWRSDMARHARSRLARSVSSRTAPSFTRVVSCPSHSTVWPPMILSYSISSLVIWVSMGTFSSR